MVPLKAYIGDHPGKATIYIDGLKVAQISFLIQVSSVYQKQGQKSLRAETTKFQSAFASYASDDREAVLARIQGIQKAAPEMDIFIDVMNLRSGQKWQERLEHEILSRDVFYLFWSYAASKSEWVRREWEFAFKERGTDFIDPVPLVSPEIIPPPQEPAKHYSAAGPRSHILAGANPAPEGRPATG